MSTHGIKKLYAIEVTASEKKQSAQMQYRENSEKNLRSYLEYGAQSNRTKKETNLGNVLANPLGCLLDGCRVPAAEGVVE